MTQTEGFSQASDFEWGRNPGRGPRWSLLGEKMETTEQSHHQS
jgi:hypothetical protein